MILREARIKVKAWASDDTAKILLARTGHLPETKPNKNNNNLKKKKNFSLIITEDFLPSHLCGSLINTSTTYQQNHIFLKHHNCTDSAPFRGDP